MNEKFTVKPMKQSVKAASEAAMEFGDLYDECCSQNLEKALTSMDSIFEKIEKRDPEAASSGYVTDLYDAATEDEKQKLYKIAENAVTLERVNNLSVYDVYEKLSKLSIKYDQDTLSTYEDGYFQGATDVLSALGMSIEDLV